MTYADKAVILLALILLPFLYIHFWGSGKLGESALMTAIDGKEIVVSLFEDKEFQISGPLGITTIEVKNGKIRFIDSPCSGKQCIHSGWLKKSGDFAACIPNRISITIAGRELRFDAINF